jgi:ATP adenylyltransferase
MKYLWSPWRMTYIEKNKFEVACAFCDALEESDSAGNLIVYRGPRAFIILNRFPYTSGHLMTVPYQHCPSLEDLNPETRAEIIELANLGMQVLRQVYQPQGFNLGINLGEAAGAGITDHIHMHVVPRWTGDTNFMSSLGHTRVLPETLEDTYNRIKGAWEEQEKED